MYVKVQSTFRLYEVMPVYAVEMGECELPHGSFEYIPGTLYEWYRIHA